MPRLINASGHLVLRNDIKRPEVLILLGPASRRLPS